MSRTGRRYRRRITSAAGGWVAASAIGSVVAALLLTPVASYSSPTSTIPKLGVFGHQGSNAGQLAYPRGTAVDDSEGTSKGDVYVADQENQRVEKFGAAGNFLLAFGGGVNKNGSDVCKAGEECKAGVEGAGAGEFSNPLGVAVDPTSGAVYVVDFSNNRVDKFDAEGKFELAFGGGVNKNGTNICKSGEECQAGIPASEAEEGHGKFHPWTVGSFVAVGVTGTVYVGDENRVQEFNANGEYQTQIKLPGLGDVKALTVNASGDVFVAAAGGEGVHEYEASGETAIELHHFTPEAGAQIEGLTVASANGPLYMAYELKAGSPFGEFEQHIVLEYEGAAPYALVGTTNAGLLESSEGLAVGRHGALYAADSNNTEAADKVLIFGKPPTEGLAGAPGPTVGAPGVSHDGVRQAQITATVDPHFLAGHYYVEYGTDTSYGAGDVPTPPGLSLPNTIETQASVELENLQPGTEYHYRFVVITSSGTERSPDETFRTESESTTALPDGRVYEQVTPAAKNGNFFDPITGFMMGIAEAGGNAILYPMSGATGVANSGIIGEFVSRHQSGGGWATTETTSRPVGGITFEAAPSFVLPSADFARFLFDSEEPYASGDSSKFANIFVDESLDENAATNVQWVTEPRIPNPVPIPGKMPGTSVGSTQNYAIAGASPDLSRVYFSYAGTLLPADNERSAHVKEGLDNGKIAGDPWGYYEWHDGVLSEAGTLPDGKVNPYGAVPAALGQSIFEAGSRADNFQAGAFDNVVSEDGSRTFFVSPDPMVSAVSDPTGCAGKPTECTSEAPELYVREVGTDGAKTTLISHVSGSPEQIAARGVTAVHNAVYGGKEHGGATFALASSDGSQVFFASVDPLTSSAPANSELKEYEYNIDTGAITYLPGVEGETSAVSRDGETLMFVDTKESPWKTSAEPAELKVWRAGAGGGKVISVAALPDEVEEAIASKALIAELSPRVRSAHVSNSGNVFVFSTGSPIEGFNNRGLASSKEGSTTGRSGLQVYRFGLNAEGGFVEGVDCLSCPPRGVVPVGDAYMSYNNYESDHFEEVNHENGSSAGYAPQTTQEARGMSADGSRVFFDTRSPLVPQAVNGKRDVYEWENGKVYLLSSGTATTDSYYLDNSESGDDVFFATAAPLVPGDTDNAYDVYDARVPRPGDKSPPSPAPCVGSGCQGMAPATLLVEAISSEMAVGLGNLSTTLGGKPKVHQTKPKHKKKRKTKHKKKRKTKHKKKRKTKHSERRRVKGAHRRAKHNMGSGK